MTQIDNVNPLITNQADQGEGAASVAGADRRGAGAEPGDARHLDRVTLSDRGRIVAATAHAVAASPEVRSRHVAALKEAIANGTYEVDAYLIATRLAATGTFD